MDAAIQPRSRLRMERQFLRGRGKMLQTSGLSNTRMSALLTLHKYNVAGMRQKRFIEENDGGVDPIASTMCLEGR